MDAAEDARPAARTTKKRPDHLDENEKEKALQKKPQAVSSRKKRPYEYSEGEMDVVMEKLYKCNYWEDPAYANKLRYFGLRYAREAALDNQIERLHREFEAYVAQDDAHMQLRDAERNHHPPV